MIVQRMGACGSTLRRALVLDVPQVYLVVEHCAPGHVDVQQQESLHEEEVRQHHQN